MNDSNEEGNQDGETESDSEEVGRGEDLKMDFGDLHVGGFLSFEIFDLFGFVGLGLLRVMLFEMARKRIAKSAFDVCHVYVLPIKLWLI